MTRESVPAAHDERRIGVAAKGPIHPKPGVGKREKTTPVLICAILMCGLTGAIPAHALTLQDILDAINTTVSRTGTLLTRTGDIQQRAENLKNQARELQDRANELRSKVQEGDGLLTPEMREKIDEIVTDLQAEIAEQKAGLDEFLGGPGGNCAPLTTPCGVFRADLIDFVNDLTTLSNSLFAAAGLDINQDASGLVAVLGTVPGRALYPLYIAFDRELNLFDSNFVQRLNAAATDIAFLRDAIPGSACELMLGQDKGDTAATVIKSVKATGIGLQLVGRIFKAIGTKEINKEGAVWGWVGFAFKNNRLKNVGIKLNAAGVVVGKYAGVASTKLLRCIILDSQAQILATVNAIKLDFSNLDVAVSTRASQSSVDALGTAVSSRASQGSVDALGTAVSTRASQSSVDALGSGVDALRSTLSAQASQGSVDALKTAVAARASQSSVDNLAQRLDDHDKLALRLKVETSLIDEDEIAAILYLPESHGGLIEFVRDVVADTIAQHKSIAFPIGESETYLEKGDSALNRADYRRAFKDYRNAYLEVAKKSDSDWKKSDSH